MAERVYEGMFLLDANKYARNPAGVSGRIAEMIEKCGGETLVSRLWAEQKLAYQIGKHRKGAYWLTYFRLDSERQGELNRASQLNNDILRHLVLTVEPRLVDTLIRHASGETVAKPESAPQPAAVGAPDSPATASPATASPAAGELASETKESSADVSGAAPE